MLKTLIFSKNRACQLELLLRSMNFPSTILYSYDPEFEAGYKKLIKMYPKFKFILRYDFKKQLLEFIKDSEQIMFLVDDDVMLRPFNKNCKEFRQFIKNPKIVSLSLRMAPAYRQGNLPNLKDNIWEWKPFAKGSNLYRRSLRNWGYPMAIGAHIFKTKDIFPIIEKHELKNPNFLEGVLSENIPDRPLMICFKEPKVINNIVNQVQTDFPSHVLRITPEELEKRFLSGERISLEDMKAKAQIASDCYLKTDYEFENYQ